ncbi:MAG TPA: hypothetical protein VN982_08125 [Candidatus Dormibacteraeota bacterium]|nr:hypothetical protein [Candidatus Dormibacteraeota bacterium]
MADWKQITARIRRARTSKDPVAQLSNLFDKTHDAMAAFELARYFETTGHASDAGKWYATAAGRFRRADWKTKAQEAALRLGASLPIESPMQRGDDFHLTPPLATPPPVTKIENSEPDPEVEIPETIQVVEKQSADAADSPAAPPSDGKRPRRRGRRGGRNRRKTGASAVSPDRAAAKTSADPSPQRTAPRSTVDEDQPALAPPGLTRSGVPSDAGTDAAVPGLRGRYGDPGLSSRLTQLEMQFRRLLTCAPSRLNEADQAPVGPGVFVLTDSDLTTYYYVEACQTLRIAIGNLIRSGSSRRGADSLKPQLAEHLGIPEARVTKYLADHCVVRWLQLDEGASHFAHFVVAVLRPKLNE